MLMGLLRSSLFISLLLIVSVTLSGCSIDFTQIFSGIKTFVGNLASGIGSFLTKGVETVKGVISTVKDVAQPIADVAKNVFNVGAEKIDNVMNVINKADGAVNAVEKIGTQLTNTGTTLTKDAVGNTTTAATTATVAARDNETGTIPPSASTSTSTNTNTNIAKTNTFTDWLNSLLGNANKATNIVTANTQVAAGAAAGSDIVPAVAVQTSVVNALTPPANIETLTKAEIDKVNDNIKTKANDLKKGMQSIINEIELLRPVANQNSTNKIEELSGSVARELDRIIAAPLNENNAKNLERIGSWIEDILLEVKTCGMEIQSFSYGFQSILKKCETAFDNIYDDLAKVFGSDD